MRRTAPYAIFVSLLLLLGSTEASARTRKDPLAGQPAIRHRHELRAKRFEMGPSFNFSINRSLRHAILFGAKLEYHINDYLSLGADVGYGVGVDAGLANELQANYEKRNQSAQWETLANRFSDIQFAGDVRMVFTPFAGKMAVFSKLFFAYDFYVFGGFGFAMTKNNTTEKTATNDFDAANEGFRPGLAWGVGMRMFFTRFFSMGLELKDLLFADNESGEDVTRGLTEDELAANQTLIDSDDRVFGNHFFVGVNFTFFFPFTAKISY